MLPQTIPEFRQYILNRLTPNILEDESLFIISDLITINKLGLITFESQPVKTFPPNLDNTTWSQRAFLNGLYPKRLVQILVNNLVALDPYIVVSETYLNPQLDQLKLYNYTDFHVPLVDGLYPMAVITDIRGNIVSWHEGYSGNVTKKQSREYLSDYFFEIPDNLLHDIMKDYSLIQIWSQNFSTNIFPLIISALGNINN